MEENIIVIGHKNPDTDAIVSALAFADFAGKAYGWRTVPARTGEVNRETKMILERTGLKPPEYVEDVYLRAVHVMKRNVISIDAGTPVLRALDLLVSNNIRSAPVINREKRIQGLFSVESIASSLLKEFKGLRLKLNPTPIRNYLEVSGSKLLTGTPESVLEGRVYIAALSVKSIKKLSESLRGQIVIAGDRDDVLSVLLESDVAHIIVTGGYRPPEKLLHTASDKGITMISSPHDTFKSVRLLEYSQPVDYYIIPPYTVEEDTLISDVKEALHEHRTVIVLKKDGRLSGIITRSDLIVQPRRKVALVDHNELSQAVDGIEEAEIVAVIDHHRLSGDIESHTPIIFHVEPLGSTSSIIWRLYRLHGHRPEKRLAEAILYAILSDTLILRSPTTTEEDKIIVDEILSYTGLSRKEVYSFMINALSANLEMSADRLLKSDFKVFDYKGYRFGVSQIMTPDYDIVLERIPEIRMEMKKILRETGLKALLVVITNYMKQESLLLVEGDKKTVERAFGETISEKGIVLKGVTSRKKQVIPRILSFLQKHF